MSKQGSPIEYRLPGDERADGYVPARAFAKAFELWIAAFEQTVSDFQIPRARVEWLITDMSFQSANVVMVARWDSVEGELVARQCQQVIPAAVAHYERTGEFGKAISSKAAEHLRSMFRIVGEAGIPRVEITTSGQTLSVETDTRNESPRAITYRSLGSLEGEIVAISLANQSIFTIRDRLDGCLITCYFDRDKWLEQVRSALLRRVAIYGDITYRATGEPLTMTSITGIHMFSGNDILPQPAELIGRDSDFTDGLPAEEWLELQRDQ